MNKLEELLLKNYHELTKDFRRQVQSYQLRLQENYEILTKLFELKLIDKMPETYYGYRWAADVKVEVKDLPLLRTKFDTVKSLDAYEIFNERENTVKVRLDLGFKHANNFVFYVKKLEETSKCKIVMTTETTSQLICERSDDI